MAVPNSEFAAVLGERHLTVLEDLGSANGTLVAGRRIRGAPLREGDDLELGGSLLRIVRIG